jgi:hypothetical protein
MSVILERAESKDEVGRMKDEPEAACLLHPSAFILQPSIPGVAYGRAAVQGTDCDWPQETPFITAP